MSLQCSEHCPKQETGSFDNELSKLFHAAYEQYQSEVLKDGKLYERYVNDLVSYHLPIVSGDMEIIRKHFRNVFCMYELLINRKDLVNKYFTRHVFEECDFNEMLYAFNHIEYVNTKPKVLAFFNRNQIQAITQFANSSKIFIGNIEEKTIDMFFRCQIDHGLVVANMAGVLPLLYELSRQKMIPYNWVSLIAENKMLIPQKTMVASTRKAISQRLSELKKSRFDFPGTVYIRLVKQLKEMQ